MFCYCKGKRSIPLAWLPIELEIKVTIAYIGSGNYEKLVIKGNPIYRALLLTSPPLIFLSTNSLYILRHLENFESS